MTVAIAQMHEEAEVVAYLDIMIAMQQGYDAETRLSACLRLILWTLFFVIYRNRFVRSS